MNPILSHPPKEILDNKNGDIVSNLNSFGKWKCLFGDNQTGALLHQAADVINKQRITIETLELKLSVHRKQQ